MSDPALNHLEGYEEIVGCAREFLCLVEAGAYDRLEEVQRRRRTAQEAVDALPWPAGPALEALRTAALPLLREAIDLDRKATALLLERRRDLLDLLRRSPIPSPRTPHFVDRLG
jgi:hypothetical protein